MSVLGGGRAGLTFSGSFSKIQFDWGSIDAYNSLTLFTTGGNAVVIPGSNFTNPANGDQVRPGTNGVFTIYATAGESLPGSISRRRRTRSNSTTSRSAFLSLRLGR